MVIRYTVANERVATGKTVRECLNWKKANEKEYNKAFRAALSKYRCVDNGFAAVVTSVLAASP